MEDNAILLQAVKRMDADALARVFDQYAPAIYKYALNHCCNDILADQVVGDVFAKLLEQLSQGNGPASNLRAYLFEIAHHLIVDHVRYWSRLTPVDNTALSLPAAGDTGQAAEQQMLWEYILWVIRNNLTDCQRQVILLRFMEGFSLKETASIMGKKVGSIKVTQTRAVAVIRQALQDQETGRQVEQSAVS
jgi:RNA polymerase sigma factor (sigma-70 family)